MSRFGGFKIPAVHILMVSRALGRLSAATCGCVGLAACHNAVCPLRVVWDLDETLVSSRRVPADPRAPPLSHPAPSPACGPGPEPKEAQGCKNG